MDNKKKYNEALERARVYRDNARAVGDYAAVARYENIFPELRESEDEMIRKEIINYLDFAESHNLLRAADYEKKKRWIAYLEKQKDAFENGRQLGIMQEQARQELEWPDEKQKERKSTEDVIKKITQNKETATKFLKSAGIMDENGELASLYNELKKLM